MQKSWSEFNGISSDILPTTDNASIAIAIGNTIVFISVKSVAEIIAATGDNALALPLAPLDASKVKNTGKAASHSSFKSSRYFPAIDTEA